MAPAKMPDALVERYARELIKALYSPEIEERAKTLGFRPSPMGGEAFASFLTEEIARWGRIIKAANISAG
jgi:tripartite-type tricarboxylate transporter receptor subunit TctC